MIKRALSVLILAVLCVALCLGLFGCKKEQEADPYGTPGLVYEQVDGGYVVTKGSASKEKDIVIPARKDGQPVIGIKERGFGGMLNLERIEIPSSVKQIGTSAFTNCGMLKEVIIPNGVEVIGERVFEGCKKIESISIPASVTTICDYAFSECSSLKTVTFAKASKLKIIGVRAFQYTPITELNLPASLESIGNFGFAYCKSLVEVHFEENSQIKSFGEYSFYYAWALEYMYVPKGLVTLGAGSFRFNRAKTFIFGGSVAEWEAFNYTDYSSVRTSVVQCSDGNYTIPR